MGQENRVEHDRQVLTAAQAKGSGSVLGAFIRLSGPGWLQAAITLGGGSLAGSLFLGAMGGMSMLWLQLMSIVLGVVMLSAISYVTLSTGKRPFDAINQHINPVLGWGWLIATSLANIIWCMPQFSLCFGSLEKNLLPGVVQNNDQWKFGISGVLLAVVASVLVLNAKGGKAAKAFDLLLKALVGTIVLCFFGVVIYLSARGYIRWGDVFRGFIPDLSLWANPSGQVGELMAGLPPEQQAFWSERIMPLQRSSMIAAAATAVGINMTFLMPYSMLNRGWDKTFRGLARFDLMTGMAIPFVLVTGCVVIASAYAFHGKADPQLLSTDPAVFVESPVFNGTQNKLFERVAPELAAEFDNDYDAAVKDMSDADKQALLTQMAAVPDAEKRIAASLVQRDTDALAATLSPLLDSPDGNRRISNFVFGLGAFGMGFSTIIILMLINGFVFREAIGKPESKGAYATGCLVAGVIGASWPFIWDGDSKIWLAVICSTFGMMLLPIAYGTFFMMMNSRPLMGKEKPTGLSMLVWNVLMACAVVGAVAAAGVAIYDKALDRSSPTAEMAGYAVIAMTVIYLLMVAAGFAFKKKPADQPLD